VKRELLFWIDLLLIYNIVLREILIRGIAMVSKLKQDLEELNNTINKIEKKKEDDKVIF